jgi:hypothetical protein
MAGLRKMVKFNMGETIIASLSNHIADEDAMSIITETLLKNKNIQTMLNKKGIDEHARDKIETILLNLNDNPAFITIFIKRIMLLLNIGEKDVATSTQFYDALQSAINSVAEPGGGAGSAPPSSVSAPPSSSVSAPSSSTSSPKWTNADLNELGGAPEEEELGGGARKRRRRRKTKRSKRSKKTKRRSRK